MKKRILSILLTLCMLFCLVPTTAFAAGETATGSAAIQLGTDALSKNVNTATAPTVYFGQDHENNPAAWRVIDYDGNSAAGTAGNMTLLAANNMGLSKFGASNAYADSALKEAIDALADKLTAKETDAVEKRTLASGNYDGENTDGVAGPAVSNAVFWPLSSKEANAVNNDLRVVDPEHPGWASSYWWLRSPDEDDSTAFVAGRGEVRYYGGYSTSKEFGVRPAFDLNLDSVLFASAAVGGKPDGGLQPVSPNYTGNEWKLTLYDSKRNNFSRTTWEVSASTKGGTVEISYTDAKTGANEYISALIFDDVGNVIYYGRSNASLTEKDGTAQLTIPAGFAEGTYTLEVFNEQYNGDRKTDLASGFADVTLTVEKRVDEQFTLTPGGRYYFDLSAVEMPGTTLETLPDSTLHYVPFTYVGTVDAYSMENETDTAKQPYEHSLFIADYNVKCSLQRETLAEMNLIYGQTYTASNVNYTLRAPSVGDHHRNEGEGSGLAPIDNEWDTIYQKSADYIKNWYKMRSFGQDIGTGNVEGWYLSRGGHFAAQATFWARPTLPERDIGFRPVLELPTDLAADSLKIIELRTGEFMPGEQQNWINIIVKNGESFTAPSAEGLPRPDGDTGNFFMWRGSNGKFYVPGDSVPADVTALTVQWTVPTYAVTLHPNGGTINSGNVTGYTYGVGATLPTADDMTNTGHTFKGWYVNENLTGSPVTAIGGTGTGNKEYWAKWEINQYTITVKPENGKADITITQDYGTNITAPADPTREGYTFIGWDKEIPTTMPAENITLKAKWKDIEKPTGEIVIGTNKWQEFLNKLTFGLFFKDTQEVTINAADNSGTVFVSYLVTDRDLSEAELQSLVFSGYEEPFRIDRNGEYIVYAMLVDANLNITYLRSDRVTVDNVQPVIGGIENGKTYCEAQTVTIDEKYVDTVTVNGTEVTLDENGSFILSAADGEQKIVATDKAGNTAEMTVMVNDGHTGGTATCTERAVCEVCGKAYGEPDPKNHTNLKHIPAKAATKTAGGNIEYWYCEDCGKYFADVAATKEIKQADTVTAKLSGAAKSPQTGGNSGVLTVLLLSGGAFICLVSRWKKRTHTV